MGIKGRTSAELQTKTSHGKKPGRISFGEGDPRLVPRLSVLWSNHSSHIVDYGL